MSLEKVGIEVDKALIDEVIRRYQVHSVREAVNMSPRSLLDGPESDASSLDPDDVDEYGDPGALRRPSA